MRGLCLLALSFVLKANLSLIALSTLLGLSLWAADSAAPENVPSSASPEAEAETAEATPLNRPEETLRLSTFDDRRQAILNAFADKGTDLFTQAECLFALGRSAQALVVVNRGLDPLVPGNKINRWMHGGNTGFIAWPGIDCYIRFEKYLDAVTKERYRKIYTGGVFYQRLSTSNHKLMAAMTRYLATQVWGAEAFHADPYFMAQDPYIIEMTHKSHNPNATDVWGTRFSMEDPTGEKYLRSIISSTVKSGPGEYASRPYGAQNVLPLLSLADCAQDPVMAKQARIAYEVCLAQLAPAWLHGDLATFAPRSYPDTESQSPWGMATLPWLYFGGVAPDLNHAKAAAAAAVSSTRLPQVIVTVGTDRSAPYGYRSRINGFALNHYVNRHYILFSRSAKVGGKPWQGQSYPCGVMWDEPDPLKGSHLWITNPAEDIPGQMGLHTHGVRSFEQEILGRECLLFVFQMTPQTTFPYALGYLPGGYSAMINESATTGAIYLNYGSVLLAVRSSAPFEWNPTAGILAPASTPRKGDSEFRVRALCCALAIETGLPQEFSGAGPEEQLRKFRDKLQGASSLKLTSENPTSALYTNRYGETVECTFEGIDKINGKPVDYQAWPTLESPWTDQKLPVGPLIISDGKNTRTYDFNNWTVEEHSN